MGVSGYFGVLKAPQKTRKAATTYVHEPVLGGSWVVISGVVSRVTIVIIHIRGLITPLITTHEPPR